MVAYFNEFYNESPQTAIWANNIRMFNKYKEETGKEIYELTIDEIIPVLLKGSVSRVHPKKVAVTKYLQWVKDHYGIETRELVIELRLTNLKEIMEKYDTKPSYFYNADELVECIKPVYTEYMIHKDDIGGQGLNIDIHPAIVYYYLSWYGMSVYEMIYLKLSHVKFMNGNCIIEYPDGVADIDVGKGLISSVKITGRKIIIDNPHIVHFLSYYKNLDGFSWKQGCINGGIRTVEKTFVGNTFIRTTSKGDVSLNKIAKARSKFQSLLPEKDIRLNDKKIEQAVQYIRLYEMEKQLGREIKTIDVDLFAEASGVQYKSDKLSNYKLPDYKKFREEYCEHNNLDKWWLNQ